MNPSTGSQDVTDFSQCTIGNICSALGRNSVKSNCLVDNRGVITITGGRCGNGIVEAGEECDCGGADGCHDDPCCDATTCKFINGAVCDDANDSCCSKCQFSPANTVCRASTGPCDIEEKCTGNSGICPSDEHVADGTSCTLSNTTLSGLQCASGQCTSRDLQCQQVMGVLLGSNDTFACQGNADSCTILCSSSQLPANSCGSLNQNFLDGTPCNGDGSCSNGQCIGGNAVVSWIDQHKPLVIGLAAGIGGLLLLSILGCIWNACRRRRYSPPKGRRRQPPPPMMYQRPPLESDWPIPPPTYGPPPEPAPPYVPKPTWYDGSGGMSRPRYA